MFGGFYMNIFDGFYHIWFYDPETNRHYEQFNVELHKNVVELDSVKFLSINLEWERVIMNVYSEQKC